jgi:molecular chaperone DnaK (HSP70)
VTIDIIDVNAKSWGYSHRIVQEYLIKNLPNAIDVEIKWNAREVNLIDLEQVSSLERIFVSADVVVVQNCINEINPKSFWLLQSSIRKVFELMNSAGALLLIDLTQSVRSRLKEIEKDICLRFDVKEVHSTLSNAAPCRMMSVNFRSSATIKEHLLTGDNNLIPRKNLVYDYSLISKKPIQRVIDNVDYGIAALYAPLNKNKLEKSIEKTFVGLDFGTSLSVCSIASIIEGSLIVKSVPIKQKGPNGQVYINPLTPTALGVLNRQFMVGRYAYDYKGELEKNKNSWYRFKSILGELKTERYPNSVLLDNSKCKIGNAHDALGVYFEYLNDCIHDYAEKEGMSREMYYSVSIPAELPDYKKNELRKVLIESGIDYSNEDFVFEPISALISAIYNKDVDISTTDENKKILIIDAGAGTFDVSVLDISKDGDQYESQILALNRINDIGGDYVDRLIASEFNSMTSLPNVQYYCERLKILMCKGLYMDSNHVLPDKATSDSIEKVELNSSQFLELSYKRLFELMNNYWVKILETLELTLNSARLSKNDLDEIIISGGGGRNPYLRSFTKSYFKNSRIVVPDNIQEQVSIGNAIHSLVSNTYGMSLLNTKISGDVRVVSSKSKEKGFKKGTAVPSVEIEISRDDLQGNQLIVEFGFRNERFVYTLNQEFDLGFIWLTSDQGLKFEILQSNKTRLLEPEINQIKISDEMDDRRNSLRG